MGGLGKKGDSMYTYVGKKRLSGPKAEVEDILEELVDVMEEKYGMKASIMTVGSVKSNLVTADEDGHFDLDYNICFSKVPQDVRNNLQGLRGRVRKAFDDIAGDAFFYGRERKPVIRFEHSEENYNLDLGILIRNNNGQYCRLVIDDVSGEYQLKEIALLYDASKKEDYIFSHNGKDRLASLYLKNKNKHPEIDSFHIYLEAVNTVYSEKGGQKMSKVSGNNHTQKQMDNHANQKNPNNSASRAAANNRANQMNPNNPAYQKSRGNK